MAYDYFYGADGADQYTFFRIPKLLVRGEQFHDISTDAKLLYGLMLDRLQLSVKNRWFDEKDRVYIIYTIEDIMEDLNCGNQKAVKILNELEKKAGLVIKKRRGLGKPSIIYVLNFYTGNQNGRRKPDPGEKQSSPEESQDESENEDNYVGNSVDNSDGDLLNCENHYSGNEKIITRKCENHTSLNVMNTPAEVCESQCNKNNMSNTEMNKTNRILSIRDESTSLVTGEREIRIDGYDQMAERRKYESYLKENLGIEYLKETYPHQEKMIEEIFNIILDTVTSNARYIRCAGDDKPKEVVKAQFLKLNEFHIEYVLGCLEESIPDIRNIKSYLLTTLYNAPLTMDSYYTTKVRYDMAHYDPQQSRSSKEVNG